jgi:hypothetical protein
VRKTGNNSSNGTSAATAWLTLGKVFNTGSPVAAGDTVYVGAGVYRESTVSSVINGSSGSRITVIGDVEGAYTGDAGDVVWSAYSTSATTTPANQCLKTMGTDYITLRHFIFAGGASGSVGQCIDAYTSAYSRGWNIEECVFIGGRHATEACIYLRVPFATAADWTIDRCTFVCPNNVAVLVVADTGTGADYDMNIVIQNSVLVNGYVYLDASGASANKGGGLVLKNSTVFGAFYGMRVVTANISTTVPSLAYNNLFWGMDNGLIATTSGQITEDYNLFAAISTPRSNVSTGTHSVAGSSAIATYEIAMPFGLETWTSRIPRPWFTPVSGSPLLGFGNQAGAPTVDHTNKPRPAGGASTSNGIGALERHDTAAKETGTTDAGGVGISISGPGDHSFLIPVDATSTTITIRGRYDTNHGTTTKPRAVLLASDAIGVATQTVTMTAAVDTWETLTFAAFTPSAAGVVEIRLENRASAGNGLAFFDSWTVA